jgi:hypothetical protein
VWPCKDAAVALKSCPQCATEFVATVTVCPDCDVALTEAPLAELVEFDPFGTDDPEVGYDLSDWIPEARDELRRDLESAGIAYVIRADELVIEGAFEAEVDAVVELVQRRTLATLDADAPKVAYDVDDLSDVLAELLMDRLAAADIAFEFDLDDALVVLEVDGARTEAILDDLESSGLDTGGVGADAGPTPRAAAAVGGVEAMVADEPAPRTGGDEPDHDDRDDAVEVDDDIEFGEADDDIDAGEVLSDLFVAADRLMHNPTDAPGVLGFVEASGVAERMGLPFGFAPVAWRDLMAQTRTLRLLLESSTSEDDEVAEQARSLRESLRPLV